MRAPFRKILFDLLFARLKMRIGVWRQCRLYSSIFEWSKKPMGSIAVRSSDGTFTYHDLINKAKLVSCNLSQRLESNGGQKRTGHIAMLCSPNQSYIASMWGIWMSKNAIVPLSPLHPPEEWKYFIEDSNSDAVIVTDNLCNEVKSVARECGVPVYTLSELENPGSGCGDIADGAASKERALLLYTSGTTGKPKGVVHSFANIESQVTGLLEAWEWTSKDIIINCLPLHHTHGLVNVVNCALSSGAEIHMLTKFDPRKVWSLFCERENEITLFMAVPTMYAKLIETYETFSPEQQQKCTTACKKLRLMVSGSMALPVPIMKKWEKISGHVLLERYGMTEIGMALSNPLHGPRLPGYVGKPLPGVQVRIVDELENQIYDEGKEGELRVKGNNVFAGYWNREEATKSSFDKQGWFKTGDVATRENGNYRIIGRSSVDILKVAGYKIGALEIERVALTYPKVSSAAVVGIEDEVYGQKIGLIVALKDKNDTLTLSEFRGFASDHLPPYKLPHIVLVLPEMPLNAMGKVNKKELSKLFQRHSTK